MKGFEHYKRSRLQIFQSMFLRKKVKWNSWCLPSDDLHKLGIYIGDTWICPPTTPCLIHSFMCFFLQPQEKRHYRAKGEQSANGSLFLIKRRRPGWKSVWVQKLSHSTLSNLSPCLSHGVEQTQGGKMNLQHHLLFSLNWTGNSSKETCKINIPSKV